MLDMVVGRKGRGGRWGVGKDEGGPAGVVLRVLLLRLRQVRSAGAVVVVDASTGPSDTTTTRHRR